MSKDEKISPCVALSWQEQMEQAFAKVAAETTEELVARPQPSVHKIQKKIRNLNTAASQAIGKGDVECAIQYYREVLTLDDKNKVALTSLGNLYIELQDYALAYRSFWDALDADQKFVPAMTGLGRLLLKQDKLADAQRNFKAALRINPDDDYALTGLAKVFNRQGMTRAAASKYELAIAANPNNFVAQTHLGLLRYEDRRYDAAYGLFKDVLRNDHGNKAGAFLKAQMDIERGDFFQARNTLISAIDRSLDESCLVLYFAMTGADDEGHKYYADKIGEAKYEILRGRIDRCRENPRWENVPDIEDKESNIGVLATLLRGHQSVSTISAHLK